MASPHAVFISYRREESSRDVEHLYRELKARLGRDAVFYDGLIDPGKIYRDDLIERVRAAKVVLVVIGRNWTAELQRRTREKVDDLVATEVETALAQPDLRVIPLLIDDHATPIAPSDVPPAFASLAERQAFRISRWEDDVARLASVLKKQIAGKKQFRVPLVIPVFALIVLAIWAAAFLIQKGATGAPPTESAIAPSGNIRRFQVRPNSDVRIRVETDGAEVNATARLTCDGKQIRTWKHQDMSPGPIEFRVIGKCGVFWTIVAFDGRRPVKFTVDTGQEVQPLTMTFDHRFSPAELTWLFVPD